MPEGGCVAVGVRVGEALGDMVAVGVGPTLGVDVAVDVGPGIGVEVAVSVAVGDAPPTGVFVGRSVLVDVAGVG
jgi:hypothetical protein